jgi:hypothetical protein
MVVVTVIGVLVINATAQRVVAGSAASVPAPTAPAPGTCLHTSPATGWVPVDCTSLHTAEVAVGWPAAASGRVGHYQDCMSAGRAYLGDQRARSGASAAEAAWSVPTVMTSTVLVSGPGPTPVKGWSWQACVVRPVVLGADAVGYRGRLRDVPATGVLPPELRRCFVRPGRVMVVGVACTAPHAGEILAARPLRIFGGTTAMDAIATGPEVQAECRRIATATTAAADPTFGGRLQVVVNLHATGMGFVSSGDVVVNTAQSYVLYQASCALQAASGRELSASVVGLGSAPLPLE